jgi:hypothetical protein
LGERGVGCVPRSELGRRSGSNGGDDGRSRQRPGRRVGVCDAPVDCGGSRVRSSGAWRRCCRRRAAAEYGMALLPESDENVAGGQGAHRERNPADKVRVHTKVSCRSTLILFWAKAAERAVAGPKRCTTPARMHNHRAAFSPTSPALAASAQLKSPSTVAQLELLCYTVCSCSHTRVTAIWAAAAWLGSLHG